MRDITAKKLFVSEAAPRADAELAM